MKQKRVIVVGAGPGGLAASLLLASKGYDVSVLEKRADVGGRNAAIRAGGFTFDVGPTFFLMKDVLEGVFRQAGKRLESYVELRELDPMYRLLFKGGRSLYPSRDKEKMRATLEAFSPGSFAGYLRYLEKERRKYDQLIPCLQMPYGRIRDFFSWQLISSIPYLDAHLSIYDVLARYFDDADTRLAFTFQAKYIGMSPWDAPGTFSIISFIEHGDGIFHVMGGLNQLSQGMARAARESGAKIRTSTAVRRVLVENRTAVGVELEDGTIERADYVVVNADFAHAMTKLVRAEDRRKWSDEYLASRRYSCSTFMLYLGMKRRYDDIPHHSIVFADDYRRNVEAIVERQAARRRLLLLRAERFGHRSVAGARGQVDAVRAGAHRQQPKRRRLAARGGAVPRACPRPHGEARRLRGRAREHRGRADDHARRLGAEAATCTTAPPSTWRTTSPRCSISGRTTSSRSSANCYLVGGGTHPGSGLPTIYESGRISAELIMKRDGIRVGM